MAEFLTPAEIRNYPLSNGETADLIALIGTGHPVNLKPVNDPAALTVGTVAYVNAIGNLRRGVVVKLTKTKIHVAFTTQGAVYQTRMDSRGIRVQTTVAALVYVVPAAPVQEPTEKVEEIETEFEGPIVPLTVDLDGLTALLQEPTELEDASEYIEINGQMVRKDGRPSLVQPTEADHAEALVINAQRDLAETLDDILDEEPTEVDDRCESEGCDIPEGYTECRRCGAELVELDEEPTGEVSPAAPVLDLTGSAVVRLLERVHERIRQNHPEVPQVVIVTGAGIEAFGGKWGHFRAKGWTIQSARLEADLEMIDRSVGHSAGYIHEMFMAGETLAKGSRQVLQTMLHESAHALAEHRGEQDTSRQGRWHNKTFLKTAKELGLEYKAEKADKMLGFSQVTLTADTLAEYKDLLDELDREINLMVRLPGWLGGTTGQDGEDEGGESMGKAPKGPAAPNTSNIKCVCQCEEPNIIRMSRKVLDTGAVRCGDCDSLFSAA